MESLLDVFRTNDLLPHGYCLTWDPTLLWTTVLSDATMALAYGSYPIAVTYFVWKRQDLQYRWLYLAFFNGFILTCAATHFMSVVTVWKPLYWLAADVKVLSAIVSIATVFAIWWVIPRALTLPSPAELRTQRSAALYARSLIEASLDPLVTISPEGKITDVNEATIRATGSSREALIGSDFSEYFTEPDKARAGYQRVLREGAVTNYSLAIRHRDGHITDVLYNASLYKNEAGEAAGVFAAARDITERKRAEYELRQHREHLEELVHERTTQLEAANKDLESFAYSVSHDLRVPLRAIDGFSRLLLTNYEEKLDDEGRRLLNVVRDNARRMGQLIDDILAFSRVGKLELSMSEADMEALLRDVWQELAPSIAGREVRMDIKPLPVTRGDPAMLRQVWSNLLSNAVKFTRPRPAAQIEIEGKIEGAECIYCVRDNGVGFDQQYVGKLFDIFQRLHGAEEFEGTGIGLAIVKRIVTRHGGRVWAEGKVGEGAAIHFALPLL